MSATSVMMRGRAAAEQLMADTCVIKHRTGQTTDKVEGTTVPTYTTVYTGKCRVQQSPLGVVSSPGQVGDAHVMMVPLVVQLPMSVTGLLEGDEITITASATDPDLVNRVFKVRDLAHKTHATARRVGVQEVS